MAQQISNAAVVDVDVVGEATWADVRLIEELYSWENVGNVQRFLTSHPQVRSALIDGAPRVRSCFGPGTDVTLRVEHRVEDDGEEQMIAFIRTPFGVDESIERLDQFDADWWLDEAPKVTGLLTFALSYS